MFKRASHTANEDADHFVAGAIVPAGAYRIVGTTQVVRLFQEGTLPATFDGRIAVYEQSPPTWAEVRERKKQKIHGLPNDPKQSQTEAAERNVNGSRIGETHVVTPANTPTVPAEVNYTIVRREPDHAERKRGRPLAEN